MNKINTISPIHKRGNLQPVQIQGKYPEHEGSHIYK